MIFYCSYCGGQGLASPRRFLLGAARSYVGRQRNDDDDDDVLTAHKHHEGCFSANQWLVLRPWANHMVYTKYTVN